MQSLWFLHKQLERCIARSSSVRIESQRLLTKFHVSRIELLASSFSFTSSFKSGTCFRVICEFLDRIVREAALEIQFQD